MSARREYLRVRRGRLIYDICGAPFGTGFFVSSWLSNRPMIIGWRIILFPLILAVVAFMFKDRNYTHETRLLTSGSLLGASLLAFSISAIIDLDSLLMRIPILGFLYEKYFRRFTYHRVDSVACFNAAVHAAVMEVIDQITAVQGIAPLADAERKPVLKRLYAR